MLVLREVRDRCLHDARLKSDCMLRRETLSRAGKAFEGLEDLLGGGRSGTFDLQASNILP